MTFSEPKKHDKIDSLIDKRIIDASHEEIVAFPTSTSSQYIYASFKEGGSKNLFGENGLIDKLKIKRENHLILLLLKQ